MARGGINKAVVRIARDSLLARGIRPTIDLIRIELGNTGSKSTILRHLKELDAHPIEDRPTSLDEELHTLIEGISLRLKTEAEESVSTERELIRKSLGEFKTERTHLLKRIQDLADSVEELKLKEVKLETKAGMLETELKGSQIEVTRLQEVEKSLTAISLEREARINSLEEKHRHARQSLEHYRASIVEHRAEERDRTERTIQILKTQNNELSKQCTDNLERLEALNRDNARYNFEAITKAEKIYAYENEIHGLKTCLLNHSETMEIQKVILKNIETIKNELTFFATHAKGKIPKTARNHRKLGRGEGNKLRR